MGQFDLSEEVAGALAERDTGVFFDWQPDDGCFHQSLDRNRAADLAYALQESVKLRKDEWQPRSGPGFAEVRGRGG